MRKDSSLHAEARKAVPQGKREWLTFELGKAFSA